MRRFITPAEFERMTANILANCAKELDWPDNILPVDIDAIIEFYYDLGIEWVDLSSLSSAGDVWGSISGIKRTIYMNLSYEDKFKNNIGLMNFTKAHELGHWCLHVKHDNDYNIKLPLGVHQSAEYVCIGDSDRPEEFQANSFASALLMPKSYLLKDFAASTSAHSGEWNVIIRSLAQRYEVSFTAMKVRLAKLKLIYVDDSGQIFSSAAEAHSQISLF